MRQSTRILGIIITVFFLISGCINAIGENLFDEDYEVTLQIEPIDMKYVSSMNMKPEEWFLTQENRTILITLLMAGFYHNQYSELNDLQLGILVSNELRSATGFVGLHKTDSQTNIYYAIVRGSDYVYMFIASPDIPEQSYCNIDLWNLFGGYVSKEEFLSWDTSYIIEPMIAECSEGYYKITQNDFLSLYAPES